MSSYSYRGAKSSNIENIAWNNELVIPYTKSVIELLPYKKLGTIPNTI
jgi:hypothetical protein